MKKPLYMLAIAMLANAELPGQNFSWARQIGVEVDGVINPKSISGDASGNSYVCGYFNNTVDFDPGPGLQTLSAEGLNDGFICKFDALGNLTWVKSIGGYNAATFVSAIAIDAAGNLCITGSFTGTADFDPSANTSVTLSALALSDVFICKWDANGSFVWTKSMPGMGIETGKVIALDASGNVYLNGTFNAATDFDPGPGSYTLTASGLPDPFVVKLDATGNFVWARSMSGNGYDVTANKMAIDPAGNVYTSGYFVNTADFDPGPGLFNMTSAGGNDVFISKLDASGNFAWAKRLGGANSDQVFSIALDAFDNVYTVGCFYGNADFDPGPATFNISPLSPAAADGFISKLDTYGNFIWARNFGGLGDDCVFDIAFDASGSFYITGQFSDVIAFDPQSESGVPNLQSTGDGDAFTCKLDDSGNVKWAKHLGGANHDGCESFFVSGTNILSLVYFRNTADFDPGPGVFNLTTTALSSFAVHKMSICDIVPNTVSGPTLNLCPGVVNSYIAGNVEGATSYTWTLPGGWSGSSGTNSITAVTGAGNGSITVTATSSCGISVTQKLYVTVNACTGINEALEQPFSILVYPNPSNGEFTIEAQGAQSLTIFDGFGKIVRQEEISREKHLVSIAEYSKGLYFLNIVKEGKTYRARLSVE